MHGVAACGLCQLVITQHELGPASGTYKHGILVINLVSWLSKSRLFFGWTWLEDSQLPVLWGWAPHKENAGPLSRKKQAKQMYEIFFLNLKKRAFFFHKIPRSCSSKGREILCHTNKILNSLNGPNIYHPQSNAYHCHLRECFCESNHVRQQDLKIKKWEHIYQCSAIRLLK